MEAALAAQVDDSLDEEGTVEIPDYNNIDGIGNPSNLEKVEENEFEVDEFDNTMKSDKKLIKTPKHVNKNKLQPTPANKKASTAKSDDLKSNMKSDKKTNKSE